MLSRGFVVLWIAMLVAMCGIGMVAPLLPVYVRDELHGSEAAVALSFSGIAVAMLVASPFVGRLGDRYGVKRFIVGGFVVYSVAGFGYLFSGSWQEVVAFRMLSGLGVSMVFPMSMAYVGRLAPNGREGAYMGAFAMAQIAGFGIGPLLGGTLRDLFSSNVAFAAMGLLLGCTALFVLLALPANPRRRGALADVEDEDVEPLPWSELLRRRFVQAAIAVTAVTALAFSASGAFLAVYIVSADGLGTGSATFVGLLLGARALTSAVLQPMFGRFADRMSRITLVVAGLLLSALGQFFIPAVPGQLVSVSLLGDGVVILPSLLALYLAIGAAEAVMVPAQSAIFVTVGRSVGMGSIMGINQMASSLGFLVGSLIGATVVSEIGIANVFRYSSIMTAVGAVLFLLMMRRAADEIRAAERWGRERDLVAATAGGG
ncbi:MAG: MFS transporter [Dehalococcoidia bacterium]|nr:MFS transporter [Dehalococcoidia bacterium]